MCIRNNDKQYSALIFTHKHLPLCLTGIFYIYIYFFRSLSPILAQCTDNVATHNEFNVMHAKQYGRIQFNSSMNYLRNWELFCEYECELYLMQSVEFFKGCIFWYDCVHFGSNVIANKCSSLSLARSPLTTYRNAKQSNPLQKWIRKLISLALCACVCVRRHWHSTRISFAHGRTVYGIETSIPWKTLTFIIIRVFSFFFKQICVTKTTDQFMWFVLNDLGINSVGNSDFFVRLTALVGIRTKFWKERKMWKNCF